MPTRSWKKYGLVLLAISLIALCGIFIGSCGSNNSSPRSYSGAGSQWNVTLNPDLSFVITHAATVGGTTDLTVNGTYQTFATGFMKLTVSSASGTGAPAAGATAFALEVHGTVFFLKPVGGEGNIIPMVPAGSCPTSAMTLSWIKAKVDSGWTVTNDTFGSFTWDPASNTGTVSSKYDLNSFASVAGTQTMTGTCANGVLSLSSLGGADLFLNQAGGAIVHVGTASESTNGDNIIVGIPPSSGVNGASAAGNYAGVVFDSGGSSGSKNFPVSVSLTASGTISSGPGAQLSDVTTGTTTGGGVLLNFNNAGPVAGSITGTIAYGGTSGGGTTKNIACILQVNANGSGQKVMACASTDGSGPFFSVILVSH